MEHLLEKKGSCLLVNLSPETYNFTPKSNNLREVHTVVTNLFFGLFFSEREGYDFSLF